jgi:hypothetical protein
MLKNERTEQEHGEQTEADRPEFTPKMLSIHVVSRPRGQRAPAFARIAVYSTVSKGITARPPLAARNTSITTTSPRAARAPAT